ncbi:MAG: CHRD domain-containing protein [Armatimonadota bacterium]
MRVGARTSALAGVLLALFMAGCGGSLATFEAFLNGANVVPPVSVSSTGRAPIDVEGQQTRYSINLFAMSSTVTAAHVHGPAGGGVNAGIIVTLFSGSAAPPVNGQLVQGTFDASSINPASGVSWQQLMELMRTGGAYVDVHTSAFPGGEVRGQIHPRAGVEDR